MLWPLAYCHSALVSRWLKVRVTVTVEVITSTTTKEMRTGTAGIIEVMMMGIVATKNADMKNTVSGGTDVDIGDTTTMIASSYMSGTTNIARIFRPDLPIGIGCPLAWSANLS